MSFLLLILPLLLLFFFTLFIILFKKYIWIPLRIHRHFRQQGVKGPGYRPIIIGNSAKAEASCAISFDHNGVVQRVMTHYDKWSKEYGDPFLYWFGSRAKLCISDPDMIKEILVSKSGSFKKVWINPVFKSLLGDGLVILESEKWSLHRRVAAHAFSMERVKEWVPEIVDSTRNIMSKWDADIEATNKSDLELDVHKEFHEISADVISRMAFGSSYLEGKRIFELQEQQVGLVLQSAGHIYIPGLMYIPTTRNRQMWKIERETTELITKLIEKNKDMNRNSNTLLATLISPYKKDDTLNLKEIIDECKTFYFTGKETTADLLTWAFLLLGLHQEWQTKARDEIVRVCGQDNVFPGFHNLLDLKIISMILNETLRLYPPAGFMTRQTAENVKLAGRLDIPAGIELLLAMIAVHHDERIWGEDAHAFNPMRFVEPRNHLASFFPFGLGPRTCIAQNLALLEAKIVLAMIVSRYTFVVSPSYVHAPTQILTLRPQYGAQIIFSKRK